MNIQILDSWLREYLDTKATSKQIAEKLSLCGPSVEKVQKYGDDWLYDIEVTTNRVDAMSVYGIAREARAILPQFGIYANLKKVNFKEPKLPQKFLPLNVKSDKNLVFRTIGVVIEDIKNWQSPEWMVTRLNAAGMRSLNSIVDITNYVMTEFGHPMHAFDYDKIPDATIIIRESKKGEKIVSLEDKEYTLAGGDIVFQSTRGEIIDLPGIIGTKNSIITNATKRVLFFVDNNDPVRIRRSSMSLGIRTVAATLNEKGVDPELGMLTILRALDLAQKITKAKLASKIYDNHVSVSPAKTVKTTFEFIQKRLGVEVDKEKISSILRSLEFEPQALGNELIVKVPSHRAKDVEISEDIVEEVARIYGYHNLPSKLMEGKIPEKMKDSPFEFEMKIKKLLKGWGGVEVYTQSLVSQKETYKEALKLKNPLGSDSEYLRTSLMPPLVKAAKSNSGEKEPFHLFEVANVYMPKKSDLPEEKMTLAGIFSDYGFREAKGIIEALLSELNIDASFVAEDSGHFQTSRRVKISSRNTYLGQFGILENGNFIYYDFETELLRAQARPFSPFIPLPKYPPQIEDLTLVIPMRTKIAEVISTIKIADSNLSKVELSDIYKNSYTFRLWYQNPTKTLTDTEVEIIRNKILKAVRIKFGAIQKD